MTPFFFPLLPLYPSLSFSLSVSFSLSTTVTSHVGSTLSPPLVQTRVTPFPRTPKSRGGQPFLSSRRFTSFFFCPFFATVSFSFSYTFLYSSTSARICLPLMITGDRAESNCSLDQISDCPDLLYLRYLSVISVLVISNFTNRLADRRLRAIDHVNTHVAARSVYTDVHICGSVAGEYY